MKEINEGHGIVREQSKKRRPWGEVERQLSAQAVLLWGSQMPVLYPAGLHENVNTTREW